jgi:hypothetical protein
MGKDVEVLETVFKKCPVCKKGSVQFIQKKILFVFKKQDLLCNACNAQFKWEGKNDGEDTYSLDLSKSNGNNKYDGEILKRHEWEKGISDFDYFVQSNTLPKSTVTGGIILQNGEVCHWTSNSKLFEERAVRQTYGGAVRVMRGVYIGGSQGESQGALRKIDNGILVLTNKRLIFNGDFRNSEYKLDKIVSVEEWKDAIEIGASNRQKVQIFTTDEPHKGATFIKMAIIHLSKPKEK